MKLFQKIKKRASVFGKSRKKVKHFFRNCKGQFKTGNNYTRLFNGFKTRILIKITALTLVQNINKLIFERLINFI